MSGAVARLVLGALKAVDSEPNGADGVVRDATLEKQQALAAV
jgi:uncharacterized protein with LGFP repeats